MSAVAKLGSVVPPVNAAPDRVTVPPAPSRICEYSVMSLPHGPANFAVSVTVPDELLLSHGSLLVRPSTRSSNASPASVTLVPTFQGMSNCTPLIQKRIVMFDVGALPKVTVAVADDPPLTVGEMTSTFASGCALKSCTAHRWPGVPGPSSVRTSSAPLTACLSCVFAVMVPALDFVAMMSARGAPLAGDGWPPRRLTAT